jgi:hypothetical protein
VTLLFGREFDARTARRMQGQKIDKIARKDFVSSDGLLPKN